MRLVCNVTHMNFPKHSTIAAYGALFVALGGTSYAVTSLAPNSVGTRQIRNHSVTPAKLAKSSRPLTAAQLRQVVADVVTDPATGVNITVHGEKGDKGDPGANGANGSNGVDGAVGPQGAQGEQGTQGVKGDKGDKGDNGAQGLPGTAAAYGSVSPAGVPDFHGSTIPSFTANVNGSHTPGQYCMSTSNMSSLVVTPTARNGQATVLLPGAAGNPCPAGWFAIYLTVNGTDTDTGFFFTGN